MGTGINVALGIRKDSFCAVCYDRATDKFKFTTELCANPKDVLKYLAGVRDEPGTDTEFNGGCEAECTGYGMQHFPKGNAIDCAIRAPWTMLTAATHNENSPGSSHWQVSYTASFNRRICTISDGRTHGEPLQTT